MSGLHRTVAVTSRSGWSCWPRWLRTTAALIVTLVAALPALAGQVILAWDASTDVTVTGYNVYYGQASHSYTTKLTAGNQTSYTVLNLTVGQTYYFAVTAYNALGIESAYSNEVSATVSSLPPAQVGIASSPNPAAFGASVTFTATVSGTAPTGNVTFTDGGVTIGGCAAIALVGAGNIRTANCATSSLAVGTHSIVASYNGDTGNGASSSSALSQVISAAVSTTMLASSLNPSSAGTSVNFTATVTGVAPTGSVNFKDGAASIAGCSAVALVGGGNSRTAVCTAASLTVGTHSITASYGGNSGNSASTSTALSQVVNKATSVTTLASSANPSTSGANVTLTATVTGSAPTGSVNFKDGAASIAGCSAVALVGGGNSRTAVCTAAGLTVGTHSVTAAYGGDANNTATTSTALSQVVNKATSVTTLASSANPSTSGASVTLTATVTGSAPTGSVNFKDGAASIAGCSAVALTGAGNSLTAACTTSGFTVGAHSVTASYGGDANNTATTSSALSQVVNALATTTTVLSSSLNPSTSGANVTFTATVTGSAPTGNVNFKDGAASIAGCSAVALTGGGNSRTATCSTASLSVATHSITASYGGNAGNNASTSSVLSQVVQSATMPTTTALVSSLNPSTSGINVTFTATVTGSAPTGNVNFKDGVASIAGCSAVALTGGGNSRTAACSTASLSVATHSITASYGGDAGNNASTSTPLSQSVNAAAGGAVALAGTDFNGDHKTDIVFDNGAGSHTLFTMNGTAEVSSAPLPGAAAGWVLAGIGDFNGDGKADLLWRNTADPTEFWIYLMNGTSIVGSGPVSVAAGYLPTQIGDFDGDGKDDILWENGSGGRWIYFMNGTSIASAKMAPGAAPGWVIAGVGDFNGDGKTDLLWKNTADPTESWIYLMNGASVIGGGPVNVAAGYAPTQIADFDGDGKADILWENGTASRWMYFMNGASITSVHLAPSAAAGWAIAGVGDFNGDGKADLLWKNSANPNQLSIYLMNGANMIGNGPVAGPAGYQPLAR